MSAAQAAELPNVAAVLAAVLQKCPVEHQPLLIALAERLAAERYRGWAAEPALSAHAADLHACAAREESIAALVEGFYSDAAAIQGTFRAQHPELTDINRSLFNDRSLSQQLTIQAQGERLGAATWRSLARRQDDRSRAETLERCAQLEEASAVTLEAILAKGGG